MNVLPAQMANVADFAATAASPAATKVAAHVDDVAAFRQNFADAAPSSATATEQVNAVPQELSPGVQSMLSSFDSLNGRATDLGKMASSISSSGKEMSPSQIIDMTLRCHELVFQAELTSNVANRSSEGVQQLFRQQS